MASTSWSIIKTKRASTPTFAPAARKRRRLLDTANPSSIRQQTLTQAQWVQSAHASLVDDAELKQIDPMPHHRPSRNPPKKDSTLTQMDFFNRATVRQEEMDLALVPEHESEPIHPPLIPQVDGPYESPRKSRKRKSGHSPTPADRSKRHLQSQGSREYRPSSRGMDKTGTNDEAKGKTRRKSRRLAQRATILSDPAENFNYFEKALSQSPVKEGLPHSHAKVEIQHSTEMDDDFEHSPAQAHHSLRRGHSSTPKKRQPVVLSSQSPVTLPPSTRRKAGDGGADLEQYTKSPLRERSVNLPALLPALASLSKETSKLVPKNETNVEASKLAKRRATWPEAQVEDSQANLWSLPETSSPQKKRASLQQGQTPNADDPEGALGRARYSPNGLEIPSTGQVMELISKPPDFRAHENLPRLHGLVGGSRPPSPPNRVIDAAPSPSREVEGPVIVHDFAKSRSPATTARQKIETASREPTGFVLQGSAEEVGDSESDFGSPIANDTQFNVEVGHRTSSPSRTQFEGAGGALGWATVGRTLDTYDSLDEVLNFGTGQYLHFTATPVPNPRLVSRSSPAAVPSIPLVAESGSEEFLLPPLHQNSASVTRVSTIRVPLNDMQPSSSLAVLPSNQSVTQRSVHPASMPHPSQISTQEATQAYLGQSSMMAPEQDSEIPRGTEKITIKDSSSMRVPMSQIPPHIASQSQAAVDLGTGEFDSEGEEDDDLNPPSSEPQQPMRQRKSDLPESAEQVSPSTPPKPATLYQQHNNDAEPSPSLIQATQKVDRVPSSPASPRSSPIYSPLRGQYTPIPGFNNETQSNFTQNGHVTAAYIHRQREKGILPKWYVPKPYQVPGYTRR